MQRFLLECESNPVEIHRLPILSRSYRDRPAAKDPLATSSPGCIAIEPVVSVLGLGVCLILCLCVCVCVCVPVCFQ